MGKRSARAVGAAAGISAALFLLGLLRLANLIGNALVSGAGDALAPSAAWEWSVALVLALLIYWAVTGFAYSLVRTMAFGRLFLSTWGSVAVLTPFAFAVGTLVYTELLGSGSGSQLLHNPDAATMTSGTALTGTSFSLGILYGFFAGFPIAMMTSIVGILAVAPGRGWSDGYIAPERVYVEPLHPDGDWAAQPVLRPAGTFRTPIPGNTA